MEDDRFIEGLESTNFPVERMESVIATVSGYHGSERFNLIKMIAHTGASYVGSMNKSITHLVCWKFEGKKYELAKKLNITVVNHSWIEDCIKKGRRVSEESYTFQSGEEIGSLNLDILARINRAKAESLLSKKKKKALVNDIDFDVTNVNSWNDHLSDEILFSQPRKKSFKRNFRGDGPNSNKYCFKTLSRSNVLELEEASTSLPARTSKQREKKFSSPERRSKGRRLVKKPSSVDDLSLEDCEVVEVSPSGNSNRILLDCPVSELHRSSSKGNDIRCFLSERDDTDIPGAVADRYQSSPGSNIRLSEPGNAEEIVENVNDGNENAHAGATPIPSPTSEAGVAWEDIAVVRTGDGLPTSSELSCVICWTDFSSTRGVLPCGHRFCFSCIQNWADHKASLKKPSTCPLCKASFICITKMDDAHFSDQKIYSQSIPVDSSKMDLYILPDETRVSPVNQSEGVCGRCFNREPEDLLIRCHFCQVRCVHSYCLDPPLLPWTCVHCKDLQMLYLHSR